MTLDEEMLRCKKWIQDPLDKGGNTHKFEDIVEGVKSGHMQFWPAKKACLVTEIIVYPNKKVLHVFLAGGNLEEIVDVEKSLVKWGKAEGCGSMTLSGRKGWKKVFQNDGWKEKHIFLEKEF